MAIHFALLISRQGKVRLAKWYSPLSQKEKMNATKEITHLIVGRPSKLSNFLDWKDFRLVYKRYAKYINFNRYRNTYMKWRTL